MLFKGLKTAAVVGIAAGGLAFTSAAAYALPVFTFAPSALNGGAANTANVTADNLVLSDFSTIRFTPAANGASTFNQTGTLAVSAFQNGSSPIAGTGLNSTFGLYFSFTAAGNQSAPSTNEFGVTSSSGRFTSLDFTFYGYAIPPSSTPVTYSANNQTPGGVVNQQVLATGSIRNGTVTLTEGTPGAQANVSFSTVLAPFFVAPVPFYNIAFSAFTNTSSQVSTAADGTITITNGGGAANFGTVAVPEPLSIGLLGLGLAATAVVRRRRQNA